MMKFCRRDPKVLTYCLAHDSYFVDNRVTTCERARRQGEGIAKAITTRAENRNAVQQVRTGKRKVREFRRQTNMRQ